MRDLRALAIASLSVLCAITHAEAQPSRIVELELPSCLDPAWREQLITSARIELREDGGASIELREDAHADAREGSIHIAVSCSGAPADAHIHIEKAAGRFSRTVQLSDVPHHLQPRTLALALAELWRTNRSVAPKGQDLASTTTEPPPLAAGAARTASGPETAGPKTPVPPTAASTPTDVNESDTASSAEAQSGAPTLSLAPALRFYFAARNALPGAQLAFHWRSWRIGAEGYYGEHADQLGSARFGLVQGFLSWELARVHFGAYGLALGPRAAIGGILASATARAPAFASSATTISWDASAEAAFWRTLTRHWRLALRLQLGYAHGTLLASDAGELARLHGIFATAGLSLELRLSDS